MKRTNEIEESSRMEDTKFLEQLEILVCEEDKIVCFDIVILLKSSYQLNFKQINFKKASDLFDISFEEAKKYKLTYYYLTLHSSKLLLYSVY